MNNPCFTCGVCCKSYRVVFHWSEVSVNNIPPEMVGPWRRHEVIMLGTEGPQMKCVALTEDSKTGFTGCSIHGRHPSVCREVSVGSSQCNNARTKHGFPELSAQEITNAYLSDRPPASVL